MPPEGYKAFGAGGETTLHPAVIVILVLAIVFMWSIPRKHMLVPFLLLSILMPVQQQIVVSGLHLVIVRILVACAWIRVLPTVLREGKVVGNGLRSLDFALISWMLASAVAYILQWQESGALINRLGLLYTAFGIYFLCRHLIRSREDIDRAVRAFALACCVLAALMATEQVTGRNLMADFGMRAQPEVRNGRTRSQGAFQHPIIAGTCGATMVPIFIGMLWAERKARSVALAGVVAATVMTVTSASSTPVAAYLAGLFALCMWPVRGYMRFVRWSIIAVLILLHIVMKAPVWALIGRISLASGSTSWHRFALVDHFIRHFGEWWLIGTKSNAQWGLDMWDTVNWYVAAGISGGLIGLICFVAVIVCGFKAAGQGVHRSRDMASTRWAWAFGASIFANTISFLGIVYFDQSIVFWYGVLAMTAAMAPRRSDSLSYSPGTGSARNIVPTPTGPIGEALLRGQPGLPHSIGES